MTVDEVATESLPSRGETRRGLIVAVPGNAEVVILQKQPEDTHRQVLA